MEHLNQVSLPREKMVRDPSSGLLIPQPVGVRCGYCTYIIFKQNEAGGRLFIHKGKPICARDRILMGSRMAGRIRSDKRKYETDKKAQKAAAEEKEVLRVAEIAVESQKRGLADSDKKKGILHTGD